MENFLSFSFVLGQEEDVVLKLFRCSQEIFGGCAEIHSSHGSLRGIAWSCRRKVARYWSSVIARRTQTLPISHFHKKLLLKLPPTHLLIFCSWNLNCARSLSKPFSLLEIKLHHRKSFLFSLHWVLKFAQTCIEKKTQNARKFASLKSILGIFNFVSLCKFFFSSKFPSLNSSNSSNNWKDGVKKYHMKNINIVWFLHNLNTSWKKLFLQDLKIKRKWKPNLRQLFHLFKASVKNYWVIKILTVFSYLKLSPLSKKIVKR